MRDMTISREASESPATWEDWPLVVVDHPLRCGICTRPIGGVRGIPVSALLDAVRRHIDNCPGARLASRRERVERFRTALMETHADRWSMEDIAEAANICAHVDQA